MTRIIIYGAGGKMGKVIENIINEDNDCTVVAGVDAVALTRDYPTFTDINECDIEADVIVDFSTAAAIPALLDYAEKKLLPVVLCTTGLSEEMLARVKEISAKTAIVKSANMSIGVNLLFDLVKRAAEALYDSNFDIEIVEKHHNQKLDAPSGTALAIADAISESMDTESKYVFDRHSVRRKRTSNEIGIHAVRGGNIIGDHDVMFCGQNEVITVSHSAASRDVFAAGAIRAAKFLAGKPAGLYNMNDLINE